MHYKLDGGTGTLCQKVEEETRESAVLYLVLTKREEQAIETPGTLSKNDHTFLGSVRRLKGIVVCNITQTLNLKEAYFNKFKAGRQAPV